MANRITPKTQTGAQPTATPKLNVMNPRMKVNFEVPFPMTKIGRRIINISPAKTRKFAAKTSMPKNSANIPGIAVMSIGVFFYLPLR